uniref:Uncharacterized protein n=1 Tax=Rhizophora mucronata TaxID=61149 RepID=A0A2P2L1K7_RHIMU
MLVHVMLLIWVEKLCISKQKTRILLLGDS